MKKTFSVAVILLFIGVVFSSSINANISNTSIESELVEITTEICRISRMKSHTVKLTQEQADELDALFDSIEERLDNIETKEETIEIFNEAIVELDKYGLLGGLSVKQTQKMVTGRFQNLKFIKLLENIYSRHQGTLGVDENINCLVAGCTNNTLIFPASFGLWMLLLRILERFNVFFEQFNFFLEQFFWGVLKLDQIRPLFIIPGTLIEIIEGTGWVFTIGMNGTKSWKGTLIGRYEEANKWAVLGFAGLNILLDYKGLAQEQLFHRHFYLGFAQQVIIEEI